MDYSEEQKNEIEALESIYFNEFEVLQKEPFYQYSILIKADSFEDDEENGASCKLSITYVQNYPDEVPVIEIKDAVNLSDDDIQILTDLLGKEASENLGTVMVFLLVSTCQEWLNSRSDEMAEKRKEEKEREEKEKEEAELKKFEGTRVTVESFLAWKAKFDFDILNLKKMIQKEDQTTKKLTGRELFERDHTLNESDIQFMQGEEEIQVDESLFQEYEDLI